MTPYRADGDSAHVLRSGRLEHRDLQHRAHATSLSQDPEIALGLRTDAPTTEVGQHDRRLRRKGATVPGTINVW